VCPRLINSVDDSSISYAATILVASSESPNFACIKILQILKVPSSHKTATLIEKKNQDQEQKEWLGTK